MNLNHCQIRKVGLIWKLQEKNIIVEKLPSRQEKGVHWGISLTVGETPQGMFVGLQSVFVFMSQPLFAASYLKINYSKGKS